MPARKTAKRRTGSPSAPQRDAAPAVPSEVVVKRRKLSDYTIDPENANKGTERGNFMLEYSVEEFGPARSGVSDADGIIRAGSHTAEHLAAAGIEDVIEVETTGKEWVVVKRKDMRGDQAKRYGIADNRTAEEGIQYDVDVLKGMLADGLDLNQFFFPQELDALLNALDVDAQPLDPRDAWGGMPEFEQDGIGALKTIKVHFASETDIEEFARLVNQTVTMKTTNIWYPAKERIDLKQYRAKDES